jgi:hypothetical protein
MKIKIQLIFDLKSKIKGILIFQKMKISFIFGSSSGMGDLRINLLKSRDFNFEKAQLLRIKSAPFELKIFCKMRHCIIFQLSALNLNS